MAHQYNATSDGAFESLVWEDKSVYALRRNKTAANLKAVSLKLAEIRSLEGADARFQTNYETLCEFPGPVLKRLFEDPYCYYWTRVAFELTRACAQGNRPVSLAAVYCAGTSLSAHDALIRHLDDFARLLLGAALLAKRELALPAPLEVSAPFAVPASQIGFSGAGSLLIDGCDGEFLVARIADGTTWKATPGQSLGSNGGVTVDACPRIEKDGYDIRLQPAMLAVPLENIPTGARDMPMHLQWNQKSSIESALELVGSLVPDIHAQLRAGLRAIVVYELEDGEPFNASHCDVPGLMVVNRVRRIEDYGIILIHEFYHSRLFALEEKGLFFNRPGRTTLHYSPWRSEPRPAHGVLHAVYVHIPVAHYLLKLLEKTDQEEVRIVTRSRLTKMSGQLKLGVAQLASCDFTTFGAALFQQLGKDVIELNEEIAEIGTNVDEPSLTFERVSGKVTQHHDPDTGQALSIRESLQSHLCRFGSAAEQQRLAGILRQTGPGIALAQWNQDN